MSETRESERRSGEWLTGFTIIELMVAASLTLLIAAAIVSLMSNALASWTQSHGALTTEGQARLALDQIEHDLQGALYQEDGNVWLVATVQASASVSRDWESGIKPAASSLDPAAANLLVARFGVAGVWLRFFTSDDGRGGVDNDLAAPVAVAYQVVRRPPTVSGQSPHYLLYRAEMSPAATAVAGFNLDSADYDPESAESRPGGILSRPTAMQALADNVIDFGVRFHGYVTDPVSGDAQLRALFPNDAADREFRVQSSGIPRQSRLPVVVEVLLRVLTPEGARKIAALEAGRIRGDWWEIATANSKVFMRRVHLPAASP